MRGVQDKGGGEEDLRAPAVGPGEQATALAHAVLLDIARKPIVCVTPSPPIDNISFPK